MQKLSLVSMWMVMVSIGLMAVAEKIKTIIWGAFNIDRGAYLDKIEAAKKKEDAKLVVLTETLKAKRALQDAKDTNAKLRESIKKVGRRY